MNMAAKFPRNTRQQGLSPTVSRLRVALATLIAVRECLADALEFANRGIETAREVIEQQTVAEAAAPTPPPVGQPANRPVSVPEVIAMTSQLREMRRTWGCIADELNKGGHRTARGHAWNATSLIQFYSRHRRKATDARAKTNIEKKG